MVLGGGRRDMGKLGLFGYVPLPFLPLSLFLKLLACWGYMAVEDLLEQLQ